jgi:hypothetical protein
VKSRHLPSIGILALAILQACASAQVDVGSGEGGSQNPPGGGGGGASGGGSSAAGGKGFDLDANFAPVDTRKADLAPDTFPFKKDPSGTGICLAILSIGQPATYGDQSNGGDNTGAFQDFMNNYTQNTNTGTISTMTMSKTFSPLTKTLLDQYNVIILQALEDSEWTGLWSYSQSDVDALAEWVRAGGALITMSGYGGNTTEVTPLNKLLSFAGISYNTDDTFTACLDNMCYCASNSISFGGWTTNYADAPALTHDLKKVGVFHGRSIKCSGSECQVFAKDSAAGIVGVAKKVGNGRVIAWGDEWVTYTSQWGLKDSKYDDAATYSQCHDFTAKNAYSVPQFWYNLFAWSVPAMDWCFTITVPPTSDPGQVPITIF